MKNNTTYTGLGYPFNYRAENGNYVFAGYEHTMRETAETAFNRYATEWAQAYYNNQGNVPTDLEKVDYTKRVAYLTGMTYREARDLRQIAIRAARAFYAPENAETVAYLMKHNN